MRVVRAVFPLLSARETATEESGRGRAGAGPASMEHCCGAGRTAETDEGRKAAPERRRPPPGSEELKEALRQEDERVRQGFFTHRHRLAAVAWMLLVGLAVTVICARWYAALDKKVPLPSTPAERA